MSAVQLEFPVSPVAPQQRRHLRALPPVSQEVEERVSRPRFARRRLAAALVLLVVVAGAVMAGRALAADGASAPPSVTVHSGETLSDVAARELPQMPAKEGVAALQRANNLASMQVDAGEQLVVPGR